MGLQFQTHQFVKHVKTGKVYKILYCPSDGARLEAGNVPAYIYKGHKYDIWARAADEMEDGRFVLSDRCAFTDQMFEPSKG